MKEKQYNLEKMTVTITITSEKDELCDEDKIISEKQYPATDTKNGGNKQLLSKYISPFVFYQAFLGACLGLLLTFLFTN